MGAMVGGRSDRRIACFACGREDCFKIKPEGREQATLGLRASTFLEALNSAPKAPVHKRHVSFFAVLWPNHPLYVAHNVTCPQWPIQDSLNLTPGTIDQSVVAMQRPRHATERSEKPTLSRFVVSRTSLHTI